MATAETDAIGSVEPQAELPRGQRLRAGTLIVALLLAFVSVLWTREAELMAFACQITESVPPMTSLGWLLLLMGLSLALGALTRRAGPDSVVGRLLARLRMSGQQMMYVYAFITVSTIIFSVGVMCTLLPELATLTYYSDPSNDFAEALGYVNQSLHITDPEVVRQMYEGSDESLTGAGAGSGVRGWLAGPLWRTRLVPWQAWMPALLTWSLFLLVMFATLQCIAAMAEHEWTLSERLPYPLVEIPLGITEQRSFVSGIPFLRDPVMWVGFILGASYGIHEMIAATTFAFPQFGREYPISRLLTEYPWSVVGGGFNIFLMPEAYGLAFFAPQDVLLTSSLAWILYNLFRVAVAAGGGQIRAETFRDTSAGTFVGVFLAALWVARRALWQALRGAIGVRLRGDELPASHVWLMRGALAGILFMCGFWYWTGLPAHYIAFAMFIFLAGTIGHARVRAVAGAATPWIFPHSAMTETYVRLFGAQSLGREGDFRPFGALFNVRWIDRGYPHSGMAAQLESYNMARRGGMDWRDMSAMLAIAVPIGLIVGWWMYLGTYYDHGANILGGSTGSGGVRVRYAEQDATWAIGLAAAPLSVAPASWWGFSIGVVLTLGGLIIRNAFLRFPFHPVGFLVALTYGQRFWAPFGIVWLIMGLILRLGGVGAYRRAMPGFLGVVIGHFFFTGIVMGLAKTTGLPIFDKLPIIWF
ncbi:MAG: DUF6785 family protein [Armatimonadota bacterium]